MRAALVVCPASGLGTAARVAGSVSARLRDAVDQLDQYVPTSPQDTVSTLRKLVDAGTETVVVLGGDGAAHAAVQACAQSETALAVIPAGTGNDLARALGLPKDPIQATSVVADGLRRDLRSSFDLGRAGDTWFATVLCAGFDSAVNERVNRMRWPRGPRRYDLAIVAELAALTPAKLTVRTETETLEVEANSVAVGNTPFYGGGIPVCPGADPADGWLDVTVVGRATRRDLLKILPGLRTGSHVDHPAVTTMRAREVSLSVDGGWIGYADGERIRPLPLDVTCVPAALQVVVK
ncbi:YegS/Rv2252/BmrU family lipid kinase [Actinocrispum sp. NPDC049592]|uniref:diacylglycerol/lipid kinase family protein n=1 Tax=Actinocrispum sp. NPDC049592 TaxID=3154835 RepID=UPI003433966A